MIKIGLSKIVFSTYNDIYALQLLYLLTKIYAKCLEFIYRVAKNKSSCKQGWIYSFMLHLTYTPK